MVHEGMHERSVQVVGNGFVETRNFFIDGNGREPALVPDHRGVARRDDERV